MEKEVSASKSIAGMKVVSSSYTTGGTMIETALGKNGKIAFIRTSETEKEGSLIITVCFKRELKEIIESLETAYDMMEEL